MPHPVSGSLTWDAAVTVVSPKTESLLGWVCVVRKLFLTVFACFSLGSIK